jgi:hypothetical protein
MGVIPWAALRHVEALRDSVALNLEGGALGRFVRDFKEESLKAWLHDHGMGETTAANQPGFIHVRPTMDEYFLNRFEDQREILGKMTRTSHGEEEDIGVERSSAGWQRLDNFVITSGFVRLLGAFEKFQMDTLKALLYYRPNGPLGHSADQELITATSDIITEEPIREGNTDFFRKPALWTWIRKSAESNSERRKILHNVYEIEAVPPPNTKDKNRQLDEWYEKRNAIAHGRDLVEMKLSEYCDVEVLVTQSVLWIAKQCEEKLKLII